MNIRRMLAPAFAAVIATTAAVGCSAPTAPDEEQGSTVSRQTAGGEESTGDEVLDEARLGDGSEGELEQVLDPVTIGAIVTISVAGITATYCYLMKRECTVEKAAGQCEDRGYGKAVKVRFSCFPSGTEGSCEAECQVNGAPSSI